MIKYSLLLYTLIIQKKSWLCPYFEIGCAEICMHLVFCAQRDLRSASAPARTLFYERNILNHWSSLYVSENTRRPSEMSLFQIRFSWVLHCFVWFRVINLNHKTVIFEVPLVTKYRKKYVYVGSQLKQIACCFTAVCWSSVCDPHFNCGIIDGGTFTLFATYLLQLTTKYDTLGMCFTLSEQTFMKLSQVAASVFLEGAAVLLAPPCHLSPSTGQSEDIRYSSQLVSALVCVRFCQRPLNIAPDKIKSSKWILLLTALSVFWVNVNLT